MRKWLFGDARRASLPWRRAVLGAIVAAGFWAPGGAQAAPAGCAALAAKYPDWKDKTLVNGINTTRCGAAAAENTGFVEVPLVQALIPPCKAEGKPEPTLQLYDNNANCIQAILAGRADTYVNDVNTVDNAVKANPDKLEKAIAVTIPYSVGIPVPKDKPKFPQTAIAVIM